MISQPIVLQDIHSDGCLVTSSSLKPSDVVTTDKIVHQVANLHNHSTQTQTFHSELPPQDLLNLSFASRSNPGSLFTATIPPHDFQSFVTDHHKRWLTQPQSPRLLATSSDHTHNQEADFVLFPTPTDLRQARRPIERAPATSRTTPNLRIGSAYHGQKQHRQNLTQQASSASPIQNPRVSGLSQDTGSIASSTSQQSNPTGQQHFYASSAPSSSIALLQQQPRPPVPLFTCNSTGNLQGQRTTNMSQSPYPEGRWSRNHPHPSRLTTHPADILFEFADFQASPDESPDVSFYSSADFDLHQLQTFDSISHPAPASDSVQTISPKDIMVDSLSAPPSTTYTNLTTPGTSYLDDSPGYMATSTDTSPLFASDNLGPDADYWPPLFNDDSNQHVADDAAHDGVTESPSNVHVAPMMSRHDSSPGQSSSRSSHQGRHSFTSGVNPRRRDKPLPVITVDDPHDTVAVKRARNTMAARKSRQKRVERNDELVTQVAELEKKVDYWKQIALSRGHEEH